MKKFILMTFLFLSVYMANNAAASVSSCYEYYVGNAPYLAHSGTYSASEATLDVEFGMTSTQINPSPNTYKSYYTPSGSGGTEVVAGPVTYSGYWNITGISAIGHHSGGNFIYIEYTHSLTCAVSGQYNSPTNTYLNISPSTAIVGDSVNFQWGSGGNPYNCTLLPGTPIATSGNTNITASLADAGTYTINCTNYFGTGSPASDTLTVLACGPNYNRQVGGSSSSPATSYLLDQLVIGGTKYFGFTSVNWDYGSLSPSGLICALECIGNEEKYIVKGALEIYSGSYEKVAGKVQDDGCSGVLTRSAAHKAITATHEDIHGDSYMPYINAGNLSIHSGTYSSAAQCGTAATLIMTSMISGLNGEGTDQAAHNDHTGQSIQGVTCVSNQTVEASSGTY